MDFRNYILPDASHIGSGIWQFLSSIELKYNIKFLAIFFNLESDSYLVLVPGSPTYYRYL